VRLPSTATTARWSYWPGICRRNSDEHYVFRLIVQCAIVDSWTLSPKRAVTAYGCDSFTLIGRSRLAHLDMNAKARDESRCGLAAEALRSWGELQLRATGVSMLPTLWPGDVLTIQSCRPDQAELGEIVLFMRWGRFFIHRIVSKNPGAGDEFLITRGDCMPKNDPPVRSGDFLGRITEVRRAGSMFQPARNLSPFRRVLAYMLCHWELSRRVGLGLWARRAKRDCYLDGAFVDATS
jgi:signal peptidase I